MISLLLLRSALASDDALVTDRPDIAESSLAVGRGIVQLEQGVALERAGGASVIGLPSLTRVGLGGDVELRMETPILAVAGSQATFPGIAFGAKWHLPVDGPSLGVLAHAELDSEGAVAPIVKLAWDTDLPAGLGLGVNAGMTTAPGFGPVTGLWAAAVGRELSEQLRLYAEASGELPSGGSPSLALDGGFTWLFNDDVQADASALWGATDSSWALGSGLSVRFGKTP